MQRPTTERWIVMVVFALILMMTPGAEMPPERAIVIVLAVNFLVVPILKGQIKVGRQEQSVEELTQQPAKTTKSRRTSIQPKIEFKLND